MNKGRFRVKYFDNLWSPLIHLANSIEIAMLSEWNQRNGVSLVIQKTFLKKKKSLSFGPIILNIFSKCNELLPGVYI